MNLQQKIEIANKRYEEMEVGKREFLEDYMATGNKLSLELAEIEQDNMNTLIEAIMKAKRR